MLAFSAPWRLSLAPILYEGDAGNKAWPIKSVVGEKCSPKWLKDARANKEARGSR